MKKPPSHENAERCRQDERFFDLTLSLLAVLERDGTFVRVNPSWERALGYRPEELLGRSLFDLIHPDEIPASRTLPFAVGPDDLRLRHQDGRYGFFIWHMAEDSGRVFALGFEVTERRRAREALRSNERKFRALFLGSPIPKWSYDVETRRILEVNDAASAAFGYAREEMVGMDVLRLRHPIEAPLLEAEMNRASLGLRRFGVWTYCRKNGGELRAEVTADTLLLDGATIRLEVAYDMTEQLRHEAELVESAELSALAADVGVALTRGTNLGEILQACADAIRRRLDVSLVRIWSLSDDKRTALLQSTSLRGDLEPLPLFDKIDLAKPSLVSEVVAGRKPYSTNSVVTDRMTNDPAEAQRIGLVAYVGHPLMIGDEVLGVIGVFAKKPLGEHARRALAAVADTIALGVQRATVEQAKAVLEEQLRRASRLEAVGSLAGGIAHDFNNLLSVIISYAQMLVEEPGTDDRRRADLQQILEAGERAAALTRQLLAFSRRQILQPRIVDLNEIVAGMVVMLRRLIGEQIDFTVRPAPHPVCANVDPTQVEQVIVNLCVNARDAMPGGGKLIVELQEQHLDGKSDETRPGPHVMLAVTDTGTGMSESVKARIFEPFFTTKEVGKGTGLGLATVFGIVRQSGGHVDVYSEPGRGSVFKVYFPQSKEAVPVPAERPRATDASLRGSETILLVEDEDQLRKLSKKLLERAGYRVLDAARGIEAVQILERSPEIALLLTDMVMPQMGGPVLASQAHLLRPNLPVVFMSGYSDQTATDQGLPPGAHFVQKPFTPERLLRKLREALAQPG